MKKYGIKYNHKRDFESEKNLSIDLLETHYSFNEADKKYSQGIIPKYSDFLSCPFPNLNIEIFKDFNRETLMNFICLYANPEIILDRAKKKFSFSERNPRSLDRKIIKFEIESEIKMGNQIKEAISNTFHSEFELINTNNNSSNELAEIIYSKYFN